MKIGMIIAHEGFRDEEYFKPKEIFEQNNIEVVTISSNRAPAQGKMGGSADVDLLIDDVVVEEFDAVVFVGGPGTEQYLNDKMAHGIVKQTIHQEKILAAICMAPLILANAGVLKHKKATVHKSNAKELVEKGAIYLGKNVEVDGKIITGDGPYAAEEFAQKIVKALPK